MTISPQDLTAEERAIVEETVTYRSADALEAMKVEYWSRYYDEGLLRIEVRRALFIPESEEPAQAECPECGGLNGEHHNRMDFTTCFRPDPEPAPVAAGEISELDDRHMRLASPEAQAKFREAHGLSRPVQPGDCENCESLIAERDELRDQLDRIPDSQPVAAVRMTPELEEVLSAAWLWSIEPPADTEKIRDAIHAVRDQAAAQPGKMEKVRDLIVFARANAQYLKDSLNESEGNYVREMMHDKIDAALAELDSYEGKVGG